jgi:hypothetical protein
VLVGEHDSEADALRLRDEVASFKPHVLVPHEYFPCVDKGEFHDVAPVRIARRYNHQSVDPEDAEVLTGHSPFPWLSLHGENEYRACLNAGLFSQEAVAKRLREKRNFELSPIESLSERESELLSDRLLEPTSYRVNAGPDLRNVRHLRLLKNVEGRVRRAVRLAGPSGPARVLVAVHPDLASVFSALARKHPSWRVDLQTI